MNEDEYLDADQRAHVAGAAAIGMLHVLLETKLLPEVAIEQARELVADWICAATDREKAINDGFQEAMLGAHRGVLNS